jgi:hypothetical protein
LAKWTPKFAWQSHCGKILKFEHVLNVRLSVVNFFRSRGISHRQFQLFFLIDTEYGDVSYDACRQSVAIFRLALRLETNFEQ